MLPELNLVMRFILLKCVRLLDNFKSSIWSVNKQKIKASTAYIHVFRLTLSKERRVTHFNNTRKIGEIVAAIHAKLHNLR